MPEDFVYIRFSSHRARTYGLRAIERQPQAYWSLKRETGPGGVYAVTPAELHVMLEYSRHVRLTCLRGPYEDLRECW